MKFKKCLAHFFQFFYVSVFFTCVVDFLTASYGMNPQIKRNVTQAHL